MGWFGMTFVPIPPEWQGWDWNDWTGPRMTGWEGPPKRPSSFPSRHSWSSPVIPAPAENAGTRGMGLEWLRMTRFGGPKFATFPFSLNTDSLRGLVYSTFSFSLNIDSSRGLVYSTFSFSLYWFFKRTHKFYIFFQFIFILPKAQGDVPVYIHTVLHY